MTLRTYMHVWRMLYETYMVKSRYQPENKSTFAGRTDEDFFRRYNAKGSEIDGLNWDSEADFVRWEEENSHYHSMDVAYARIGLWTSKREDGWRMRLGFSVYGYAQDVINLYEALNKVGIGVESECAERLKRMAEETDWVQISPLPNHHHHDGETGSEMSLPSAPDDITCKQWNELVRTIKWEKEEEVESLA